MQGRNMPWVGARSLAFAKPAETPPHFRNRIAQLVTTQLVPIDIELAG
jgi:hypothetical protein